MKAIVCTQIGDPLNSVQLLHNVAIPKIKKSNQVLVQVYYASINPCDWKHVNGKYGFLGKKTPFIPGIDLSGRVIAKGKHVYHIDIGDSIYGQTWISKSGSMAQFAIIEASNCSKIPSNVSLLQAAAIPLVSITSYQALTKACLKKGDKLLIFGGSTACGLAAIQIAKNHFECDSVTVTSTNEALCTSLGADVVINYKHKDYENELKDAQFDVVYDCVGGEDYWINCKQNNIIKTKGHYITIVGDDKNGGLITPIRKFGDSWISYHSIDRIFGNPTYDFYSEDPSKNLLDITELVECGKLKPIIDGESPFKLCDFGEMFKKSMSQRAKGKLILEIGGDSVAQSTLQKYQVDNKITSKL